MRMEVLICYPQSQHSKKNTNGTEPVRRTTNTDAPTERQNDGQGAKFALNSSKSNPELKNKFPVPDATQQFQQWQGVNPNSLSMRKSKKKNSSLLASNDFSLLTYLISLINKHTVTCRYYRSTCN